MQIKIEIHDLANFTFTQRIQRCSESDEEKEDNERKRIPNLFTTTVHEGVFRSMYLESGLELVVSIYL